nr:DUF397 domain-containing protein [Actinomadura macrotermitis]
MGQDWRQCAPQGRFAEHDRASHGGHAVIQWRKASRSNTQGGDCVEVARFPAAVGLRDSKDPEGPRLVLGRDAFKAFTDALKAG